MNNDSQGSQEHNWMSWAPSDGNLFCSPFLEQTTRPPGSGKEQAIDSNHQGVPERPEVNDKYCQDCAQQISMNIIVYR
jgi:hypothetical protein